MIQLTSGEWGAIAVFLGMCALLAIRRPLLQWADAHHARKAAQRVARREDNDHDADN